MQLHAHPDVAFSRIDEADGVLLHLKTKQCYSLNETGIRIWELLETPRSLSEIVDVLSASYTADESALAKYVRDFIDELKQERLVLEELSAGGVIR